MTDNNKMDVKLLIVVALVLIITAIVLPRLDRAKDPDVKTRVPTLVESQLQAQKAAQDAQAAATQAQAAAKDLQDKISKLDASGRTSNGELKAGRPEVTNPGNVTEIRFDDGFLFTERTGYVKKFEPLCSNQTIPAGKTVVLQFHWKVRDMNANRGECYVIDGYSEVK